jgi:hypothetical protein
VPIPVVAADTGQTIASISPQGVPVAIALSERVLAMLARTPLGLRLSWYRSTTGRSLGSMPVSRTTAALLTNTDRTIVYRVGFSLRAVDVRTHRVRTLARAAAVPIGLSLDGSWLRWAENLRDSARIRALYVSDSG